MSAGTFNGKLYRVCECETNYRVPRNYLERTYEIQTAIRTSNPVNYKTSGKGVPEDTDIINLPHVVATPKGGTSRQSREASC